MDAVGLLRSCTFRQWWALPPVQIPLQRTKDCNTNCCQNAVLKWPRGCCNAYGERATHSRAEHHRPLRWAGARNSSLHHSTEQSLTVWVCTSKAWIANSFFIVWREEWGQKLAECSTAYPALLAAAMVSNELLGRHPVFSKRKNKSFSALGNNWGKSYPLSLLFGLCGWMGDYPFCVISQSIRLLSIAFPSYSECTAMWCFPRCLLIHMNSQGMA